MRAEFGGLAMIKLPLRTNVPRIDSRSNAAARPPFGAEARDSAMKRLGVAGTKPTRAGRPAPRRGPDRA